MKRFAVIAGAALAAISVPAAALAATPGTTGAAGVAGSAKSPLVNDCGLSTDNGDCLSLDMIGSFAGVVKYRQKAKGDLRLVFNLKSGAAHATYDLEMYCGQTALSRGAMIGSLNKAVTTDAKGAGQAGPFEVPLVDLQKACGTGKVIGHIELVDTAQGSIISGAPIAMQL